MPIPTQITNRLRRILDERVPRFLRDARWFMAPLFFVWCKGRGVRTWMDFKELAPAMTAVELREVYGRLHSFASGRETDTNAKVLRYVIESLDRDSRSLADIGCGSGYFLRKLQAESRFDALELTGCDLRPSSHPGRAGYVIGDHEALPFADRAFDVVTCMHTLEHARRFDVAVAELRRICRRQLVIVVPRQHYMRFTMDLHLQFFPSRSVLARALGVAEELIRQFDDDLVYVSDQPDEQRGNEDRRSRLS